MFSEKDATSYLMRIGIPASILGFQYVRTALMLAGEDGALVYEVTTRLYPEIARRHNTTAQRAERAIRHAIELAWERGDYDFQHEVFGYSISPARGKPTNSEFVSRSVDYLHANTAPAGSYPAAPDSLKREFLLLWDMFCKQRERATA